MRFLSTLCVFFSLAALLSGCTVLGVATGAGATVGVATERQGGLSAATTDVRIKALIADKWFKYDLEMFHKLNLTVDHGRVLITGIVQKPDSRVQAVRLAWQVEGVTEVINEIRIADSQSLGDQAMDSWITTRLRATITFDKDVQAINYSIDTVDGIVYLMGIAEDKSEADYVVQLASEIPHVRQVISYIKIAPIEQSGDIPNATAPGTHNEPTLTQPQPGAVAVDTARAGIASPPPAVESESLQPQPVQSEPLR